MKSNDTAKTGVPRGGVGKVFFSGVLVLTVSTVMVKLIGLILKILLLDYLGEEGMAYFNAAYTIYAAFYILSTAGFPVAVSILISESRARGDRRRVQKVFRIALGLFVAIGALGWAIMAGGAGFFASVMQMPAAAGTIRAIAPTIFFICISSAIRGYFQGHQIMMPTAISQIIESVGKVAIGILLARYALSRGCGAAETAAWAITGLTVGVAVAMLFLIVARIFFAPREAETCALPPVTNRSILRRLVVIAIPVTISALVQSLTQLIDTMLIVGRLQDAGYVSGVAERMFGNYTTLVIPLFNLPPALISPIALALVPMLTLAIEQRDREKMRESLDSSLRLTVLIALPCAVGLSAFARPILSLIFPGKTESIDMAAPLLSLLGLSVFFVGLVNVTNAILQAYSHERKPILSMLAGSTVKLVVSYCLIGMPAVNLFGAPIGTFLCHMTVTAFNFYFIARHTGDLGGVGKLFGKPLVAAISAVGGALGVYLLLVRAIGESRLITLAAIALAALLYLLLILLLRAVRERDIVMLPAGEKIARLLHRLHLLH